jgi:hypothetical protein
MTYYNCSTIGFQCKRHKKSGRASEALPLFLWKNTKPYRKNFRSNTVSFPTASFTTSRNSCSPG